MSNFIFKHPFTCMIAGPTSSGKTVLVENIINHRKLLIPSLKENAKILWCYGQWQSRYSQHKNIQHHQGMIENPSGYDLVIIDDLMHECGDDPKLMHLFTKGSHHLGVSVIFIVQNIFHQGKNMRNISLNCHHLILMKNPRDKAQIYALARQLYPIKINKFVAAYEDATALPYSYIKVDLTAQTLDKFRVQTNIIPLSANHSVTVYEI